MPGLAPGIDVFKGLAASKDADDRDEPGHHEGEVERQSPEDYCAVSTRFLTAVVDGIDWPTRRKAGRRVRSSAVRVRRLAR